MILHAGWREKAAGPPNAFHHHHPKGPLLEPYFNTQRKAGTERFGGIEKDGGIRKGERRFSGEYAQEGMYQRDTEEAYAENGEEGKYRSGRMETVRILKKVVWD